jgi:hypothetical protein
MGGGTREKVKGKKEEEEEKKSPSKYLLPV